MRITIMKPKNGKVTIVVSHKGLLLNFRRLLEGVDVDKVPESLRPVLDEWDEKRKAIQASASGPGPGA
jgi:hypothetical protein